MKPEAKLEEFYDALISFIVMSKHQLLRSAAEHELTSAQAMVLLMARGGHPRPMNSYCGALGCDPSNVTGIIDGLQKKGMISRIENPQDRRVKMVQLEPAGKAVRDSLLRRMVDNSRNDIQSKLTPDELTQFIALIQKVTAGCPAALGSKQQKA